ncbi:MAG: glutamate synthase subunit alpha [Omnitrophica WOR_2 bacterium RIFCSPLOWO2_02_FULL_63_16]|nr:MAG: glutamate synthase subunit alpha [Omnitrophica WOR_2 bacterium GWA2_63_20]OGX44629.1 MAG: glutamate synthase subunit alpha [Omnitrophica WOR_2 bacterium RIFCSPLOWO2_02_FULL_63_16]OGX49199.1 MAG: glutamate synthase subunit alpha [Omnitrophica WOR_2 bacterium RIFCSPLOWO2_12_FULL_63_16]
MRSHDQQPPYPLYQPAYEHDACGTGFVASIDGIATHQILQWGIGCVCNVTHRGAVSADAKTGDGAGILTNIPHQLFAKALTQLGASPVAPGDLAVGMVFFPHDSPARPRAQALVERELRARRITLIGWRDVPVEPSVLGEQALQTLPVIRQALMSRPASINASDFERALFLARRRIERAWEQEGLHGGYIPSFSSRTIVYKGLLVAPQLQQFYRDLSDPDYATSIVVFHQRYSTNTFPNWFLAQPFRFLGHNGEINTLQGNRNWMRAREAELVSKAWGKNLHELLPIIQAGGSDSMSLDNVLELLVASGRDLLHAMMMLVPDAWQNMPEMDEKVKAFHQYHALLTEPWDGPAALAFTDGAIVGACLDRNGLRPARYWVTDDRIVIMASEVGVVAIDPSRIVEKGRLGPGHIMAVDTTRKRLLSNAEIKREYASSKPYGDWVAESLIPLETLVNGTPIAEDVLVDTPTLLRNQLACGYTEEELRMIIEPMAKAGKEPVWSMGDDVPLSVLSSKPKALATYFKQLFAQVTNPPIDPIREELVMSLNTVLGARPNVLEEGPLGKRLLFTTSPVLLPQAFAAIRSLRRSDLTCATVAIHFEASQGPEGLQRALKRVCEQAVKEVDRGAAIVILSDHGISASKAPIPSLLATAAVHHHLIRTGRRMKTTLVVEAGDVHEVHHVACLVGYGASALYPYLAYQTIKTMEQAGRLGAVTFDQALQHYKKAVEQGLLKIMSKMGISTVGSYRGAQIFEAVGLSDEVVQDCFPGTPSRIGGVAYEHLAEEVLSWHRAAFQGSATALQAGGFYAYRRDGEYHAFNPEMVRHLQQSIKLGDYDTYKKFAQAVNSRPPTALRDLLDIKPLGPPVPLEEVEPIESICARFATASISYGALSLEAHQTMAIAMNRLGAKSGSGEGGEDPARYHPTDPSMNTCSAIKQIASGRFGVTPEYVMSAKELEIKMAQGSKPGEGGQLPGHKVSPDIARVRHTIAGISLISPPPHHDIYSIEDLAQLIYDLKMVNPKARVNVKLVAEAGVGTIAAGVAKGHADTVLISGHDGGTGASPLSSIKHAGLPWELGLAETQQTLRANGLRDRILIRTDGGMKTGRDVVIAALFGAEEYGFGTAAVVATGCVMTRQCHLNTCPVGVATQDPALRARFTGTPEMVVNYLTFVAQEIREIMASIGARRLEDLIGRTELLTIRRRDDLPAKAKTVDLSRLIASGGEGPRYHLRPRNDWEGDQPLDDRILEEGREAIERRQPLQRSYRICNVHRTVGARVAGVIATRYGDKGLPAGTIDLIFEGTAGQSFGAFCIDGMRLRLIGEANDYVGKAMGGGELIIRPPDSVKFVWHKHVIIGNTCLYGATGGYLYAAGRAGERFGVRNSGAVAVIEGLGDHGCEYMTGGIVLVLGETGRNFGAGMTGGRAYVLDEARVFEKRVNLELVELQPLDNAEDVDIVRTLIERHFVATKSNRALSILTNWEDHQRLFWMVIPRGAGAKLEQVVVAKEG